MGEAYVERARVRMWLYLCARDVLGAAMRLLSIRPQRNGCESTEFGPLFPFWVLVYTVR